MQKRQNLPLLPTPRPKQRGHDRPTRAPSATFAVTADPDRGQLPPERADPVAKKPAVTRRTMLPARSPALTRATARWIWAPGTIQVTTATVATMGTKGAAPVAREQHRGSGLRPLCDQCRPAAHQSFPRPSAMALAAGRLAQVANGDDCLTLATVAPRRERHRRQASAAQVFARQRQRWRTAKLERCFGQTPAATARARRRPRCNGHNAPIRPIFAVGQRPPGTSSRRKGSV